MAKNIYEILDEVRNADSKKDKLNVLANNWNPTLKLVLQLAYHPDIKWTVKGQYPEMYVTPDTKPGISYSNLTNEIKRLYIFRQDHPTAHALTEKRRSELLLIMLESLEPREADVVIGIFKKDLGVKGLNHKFLNDNIPGIFTE
jgi:hypothetical protein